MADSIREQIISAIMTRLATMRTASGYNYNCGANVFKAQKVVFTDDLPACVFFPKAETSEPEYGINVCTMAARVETMAEIGDSNQSVVTEKLLADMKKCILNAATEISSYIDDLNYTGGGPATFGNDEDTITSAYFDLEIKYNEKIGDPYSQ